MKSKEEWYEEMQTMGKLGWKECCYCVHYEEFAFPREGNFKEWCEKKGDYIENCDYESGCKYFDIGSIDDWDY